MLGHKALAVSLSDIAAMGGMPKYGLISLGVPESLWKHDFLDLFYEGWHELAAQFGVELVGGDISRADSFVIDSFVMGEGAKGKAFRRSGAKPGDIIFVTGELGGAALGLQLLESGLRLAENTPSAERNAMFRQLKPFPQITTGISLQQNGLVTSAIDISDGLSSDIHHVCDASGVGASIDSDKLPIARGAALEMALEGGEDFELLFTVEPGRQSEALELGASSIGTITDAAGVIELIKGSKRVKLPPRGFRHF
jgi:thiamine-monophosphate kinase